MENPKIILPPTSNGGLPRARARFLTQSIQLEEANPPGLVRAAIFVSCAFLVFVFAWSAVTEVDEVTKAPGEIVPSGQTHQLQHFEGGIVDRIHVKNGDAVMEGQILITLAPQASRSDHDLMLVRMASLSLKHERLQALIKGVQPNFESFESQFSELVYEETATYYAQYKSYVSQRDVIKRQITQREQELRRQRNQATSLIREVGLIQDQLDIENSAKGRATISKLDILSRETRLAERENSLRESEDSIAVSESAVQEAKERLRELNANKLGELRVADSEVLAEIAEAKKTLIKSNDKVDRLEIRAPVNGFIEDLKITAIGGVIKPGQDILTVVPSDEDLIVEARVSTTDIGHVHVGLAADVKVTSYDAFRFGSITGSVRRLSASTYLDEQEIPYYLAEVALEHDYVGGNSQLKVIPGMTVSADIKTGKKTILSYLVKPISRGFSQSFQER